MDENAQIELSKQLGEMLLKEYEKRLACGDITDTGMANLQRLLMANGWSIDERKLAKGLRDKLTQSVDPTKLDEDDADVLPLRRQA